MCTQCSAHAVVVKRDVLPGITLMRATKDTKHWPLDWFGLVKFNDPMFVFKGPLRLDPCHGLSEDDLDWMPEHPEGYDEYATLAEELTNVKLDSLVATHEFVQACLDAGYHPKEHGYKLGYWLGHHLAQQLESA